MKIKREVRIIIGIGLNIYLVDNSTNWDSVPERQFEESPEGGYTLELEAQPGEEFKFYVLCKDEENERLIVEKALKQLKSVVVTGIGDPAPGLDGMWRIWFFTKNVPIIGAHPFINNVWGEVISIEIK